MRPFFIDVTIENKRFIYKLYDKRDDFSFSIVRMPHMCSNIPKAIFYSALVGEYLRIGRSTLKTEHFTTSAANDLAGCKCFNLKKDDK